MRHGSLTVKASSSIRIFSSAKRFLCCGATSLHDVTRLLGRLTFAFLLRRSLLSTFASLYEFFEREPSLILQRLPASARAKFTVALDIFPRGLHRSNLHSPIVRMIWTRRILRRRLLRLLTRRSASLFPVFRRNASSKGVVFNDYQLRRGVHHTQCAS